ncbi:hypothetical protein [Hymenobacter antarcticus]|uniref:Outer membrane protein beta-barrel domain-containing protein n=1 Tax=Hymenobacter antarcticus TaxID=486270 RepID=A0ABP7QAR1_9BACT
MKIIIQLALLMLPLLTQAQVLSTGGVGLEFPAPAAPRQGHFLAGAYVSGSYAPVLATGAVGYSVQPYLRYVLGTGERARAFVQYNLSPYLVQAYGSAAPLAGPGAEGRFANPLFAPLPLRGPAGYGYNTYSSGLGSLSVGVPVRVGGGSMMVHVGGSLVSGLLGGPLR